jgi:hypothetical protein
MIASDRQDRAEKPQDDHRTHRVHLLFPAMVRTAFREIVGVHPVRGPPDDLIGRTYLIFLAQ